MTALGPVVRTTLGEVRGRRAGATICFRGIPYGGPTGGAARFLPATAARGWDGILEASINGPACPQPPIDIPGVGRMSAMLVGGNDGGPSEDCLTLNLWTPAADAARRPVMVWLHGGGYAIGSGSQSMYDGQQLATRGDVVIVSVTHRLGALGYLYLEEIAGEAYQASGNVGNLDIVLALEWVRDNIAAFGGDPQNVTVFGESGGGRKVTKLLAMPAARGLFHRAIIQSGAQTHVQSPDQATRVARATMEKFGVTDVAGLQQVPAEDVVQIENLISVSPVLDGVVLPKHPLDSMLAGEAADVPVIVGITEHEGAFGLPLEGEIDEAQARAMMNWQMGEETAARMLPLYEREFPDLSPERRAVAALTDFFRFIPATRTAEALAATNTSSTYMFVFSYPGQHPKGYAPHGCDVAYTWDWPNADPERIPSAAVTLAAVPTDDAAKHVANQLADAWIAFARTGDPNHPGMTAWAPYNARRRATLFFGAEARLDDDPWAVRRTAWDGVRATGTQ